MKDIDEKIREALYKEDSELLEHYRGEQSIRQMVIDSFRSRNRWIFVVSVTEMILLVAFEFFAAYRFTCAETTQGMLAWATGFIAGLCVLIMIRNWYWMELNKNSITREIKRLELELANLSRRLPAATSQK